MGNKIQFPMASESEVVLPMKSPYVILRKPKADAVLNGKVEIRFPKQCAWCGSEAVSGLRSVQLYEANPRYRSRGQRLLQTGVSLTISIAAGGVMSSQAYGLATYSLLAPQDVAKVKGLALSIAVPHCAEHANTAPEGVLSLVGGRIRVRDAEYARVIARINNPTMSLPALTDVMWPQQCIVCGAPDASERYRATVKAEGVTAAQDESVAVPVCVDDLKKVNRREKIQTIIERTALLMTIGVGGLTFTANADLGGHLLLCIGGGLLAGLLWGGVLMVIAALVLGVSSLDVRPVSITLKDEKYLLEFQNTEMAETVRQINGLTEST